MATRVKAAPRVTNSTRVWGALDLAAAALVVAALAVMIGDQVRNDAFMPEEYFSYFTIQSSLINIAVLGFGGVALLRVGSVSTRYTIVRAGVVAYGVVTGVVYNALLRGIDPEPGVFVSDITWPNEVVHVVLPLYLAVEWVLHRGRSRLPTSVIGFGLIYPLAWVIFSLVRGATDGWYPYDFLDPDTAGWGGTAAYVVGIAVFITLLVTGEMAINRRQARSGSARDD